ncbi:hypothetical protein DEI97_013340 [Curtobacterium sp. MCLR17_032]|uniref:hypothetical protein n=1 Tax=Curtobacterium sp. MCLR17_032 TaxID=2175650 RepID=UPI000DA73098|nr:hypothetical protein [Curtobacterium sp. MCLR17_032]WIE60725.1 hypothetical protein DEI97_013340 [Curtobacterium sp. MCLR17_032]
MTDWFIGDLLTGRISTHLQVSKGSWDVGINSAGSISITVPLTDPDIRRLNLRNVATVGKSFLGVAENGVILNAGPVWVQDYSKDVGTLTLNASGMWSYFDHRVLIPVLAAGQTPFDVETYYENVSLTTVARRLVAQAQQHTNGNVPVVLPAEVSGTETREYQGADLALVGDALGDLTSVDGGPEIDFLPRFKTDPRFVEWVMRVGTPSQPQLSGLSTHVWDYGVGQTTIRGLNVKVDGSKLQGRAWGQGGSASDATMFSTYTNTNLLTQGFPLLELVDASRNVDEQYQLDGYVRESARTGSKPVEFWDFQVQADQSPRIGEFNKGDYCLVKLRGDLFVADGVYRRRITNLSGDQDGRWVSVTTGELYALTN